jgi:predicted TPR repeat methyltransferase
VRKVEEKEITPMNRFDLEAQKWDTLPRRVELAEAVVEAVRPYLKGDERVLDFGCGTGLVGLKLAPYVREVIGIDLSKKMVEEFNRKREKFQIPNARAYQKDIFQMEGEKFDFIVSSMTLHHIGELEKLSSQFARLSPKIGIADLVTEDGSFHTRGVDDVAHFGFSPSQLVEIFSPYYPRLEYKIIHTIQKHKPFPVFLLYGERKESR